MANEVQIDPRYLSYDKADVEELLGKVDNADAEPTAESENMISSGAVHAALGGYPTKTEMNTALGDYETKEALNETLGDYSTTEQMNEALSTKMPATDIATEANVRGIVSNYNPDGDSSDSSDSGDSSDSE